MSDEKVSMDELPAFAATREYVFQYGNHWATWALPAAGLAMLAALALAFSDPVPAPASYVLPSLVAFGGATFVGGFFVGVLWTGLIDDAKERAALKDCETPTEDQ